MRWLLVIVLLAPLAQAQAPEGGFALAADGPVELPAMGSFEVMFNVTLACQEVAESLGEADVQVALKDAPPWLSAGNVTVHAGLEDCVGQGSVTVPGVLTVRVEDAPGLVPFTLELVAVKGDHEATAQLDERYVAYRPGHTMAPDGDQVFQVDSTAFAFDLVLDITANADTMVMFENKVVSGTALLTGLKARIFDVAGGERQAVHRIEFVAPEGPWTEETVSFYTYSHCLDGPDCGPQMEQNVTWTFRNTAADPAPVPAKESPLPGAAVVLFGLLLLARRR